MTMRDPAVPTDGLQGRALRRAMVCILFGLTICVLDHSMLNLALPQMARQWQASPAHTLWVVNANQIAALVMLLPLAALGERLGYKRVYLWGMLVFGVGGVWAMLAPSLGSLIAARTVQGLGMAGALSVNAALVRQIYPQAMLGKGMALNSMVVALSTVSGPVIAAAVLSWADWRWLFALHLPLSLALCVLGRKALPVQAPKAHAERLSKLDALLNVVLFAALFMGLDALSRSHGSSAWSASWQAGCAWLALSAAAGWWYVQRQRQLHAPMLPLDLLRIPANALSICASVHSFAAQTIAFLALPFLLMESQGMSTAQTGVLLSAWPLGLAVAAPWVGRRIGKTPANRLGAWGMALFACGLTACAVLPDGAQAWDVAWRLALCGVGFAMFQSPNNHTIITSAPVQRSAAASGMLGSARHVGQGIGAVLLAGCFVLWHHTPGLAEQRGLWLAASLALGAGVFSVLRSTPVKAAG